MTTLADDYAALRTTAGARAVRRDLVRVQGPDAESYLQGQCSQDVSVLAVGDSTDALLLSPQGKLEALVRVTRAADDTFVLDTDGGFGPAVQARLQRFKLRVKAEIEPFELACVSVRGPDAPAAATGWTGVDTAVPFSWGGVEGVDLFGPDPTPPPELRMCGPAAWEALRVEAGIPVMGAELDERTIAAEADLLERCVSFTKGCYTGQELVARLDARGNRVARHLRGIVLGGAAPEDGDSPAPIPPGTEIVVPATGKVVGTVTSSAWSPALGAVALGYLHRDVTPPARVALRLGEAGMKEAEVRALPLGA